MANDKLKFGRFGLQLNKNPSTLINQGASFSINSPVEIEPTYLARCKETPLDCYPADWDCNYFLSVGCRKNVSIPACQLGFPFSDQKERIFTGSGLGKVSYNVKYKVIVREGLDVYVKLLEPIPVFSSTTYYTPRNIIMNLTSTTYST
jgi:hypothetical protein